jgi:hypothetical protein
MHEIHLKTSTLSPYRSICCCKKSRTLQQATFLHASRAIQGSHWSAAHCTQFFFTITGYTHQRGTPAELLFAYDIYPCACTNSSEANDLVRFFAREAVTLQDSPGTLMANRPPRRTEFGSTQSWSGAYVLSSARKRGGSNCNPYSREDYRPSQHDR